MTDRTATLPTDNPVGRGNDAPLASSVGMLVIPPKPAYVPRPRTTFDDLHHPAAFVRPIFWYRLASQLLALTVAILGFFHLYRLAIAVTVPLCLAVWIYGCVYGTRDAVTGEIRDSLLEDAALAVEERDHWRSVESTPCDVWPQKVPAHPHVGYVYVLRFSTGTVKVGQTNQPARRLGEHRRDAAAYGVTVTSYWVSPSHWNCDENESALIEMCRQAVQPSKKEYFHGLDFASVVDAAARLPFLGAEGDPS